MATDLFDAERDLEMAVGSLIGDSNIQESDVRAAVSPVKRHRCDVCSKCFARKDVLKAHSRIHTGERPHVCDVCDRCFREKFSLRRHMLIHTKKELFVCDVCCESFNKDSNLRAHKLVHSGEKPFVCPCCPRRYKTRRGRDLHKDKHMSLKRFACLQCGRSFSTPSKLDVHVETHSAVKTHQCSFCNLGYAKRKTLLRHIDRVHIHEDRDRSRYSSDRKPNAEMDADCNIGSQSLTTDAGCPTKSESMSKESDWFTSYQNATLEANCKFSSQAVATGKDFPSRNEDVAEEARQVGCLVKSDTMMEELDWLPSCPSVMLETDCKISNQIGATRIDLPIRNQNLAVGSGGVPGSHSASQGTFLNSSNSSNMIVGIDCMNSGQKSKIKSYFSGSSDNVEVQSPSMGSSIDVDQTKFQNFNQSQSLKDLSQFDEEAQGTDDFADGIQNVTLCLMDSTDGEKKLNVADDELLMTVNDLSENRSHEMIGTADKPFICEFCQKRYKKKYDLNLHRYGHMKVKIFECHLCDKDFASLNGLKYHLLNHSNKKAFPCSFCIKGYTRRSALQRHINKVHKKRGVLTVPEAFDGDLLEYAMRDLNYSDVKATQVTHGSAFIQNDLKDTINSVAHKTSSTDHIDNMKQKVDFDGHDSDNEPQIAYSLSLKPNEVNDANYSKNNVNGAQATFSTGFAQNIVEGDGYSFHCNNVTQQELSLPVNLNFVDDGNYSIDIDDEETEASYHCSSLIEYILQDTSYSGSTNDATEEENSSSIIENVLHEDCYSYSTNIETVEDGATCTDRKPNVAQNTNSSNNSHYHENLLEQEAKHSANIDKVQKGTFVCSHVEYCKDIDSAYTLNVEEIINDLLRPNDNN